jgi:hypothetical protein
MQPSLWSLSFVFCLLTARPCDLCSGDVTGYPAITGARSPILKKPMPQVAGTTSGSSFMLSEYPAPIRRILSAPFVISGR